MSLFCLVDDRMSEMPKRSEAKLYPSELATIGLLYALKGGFFRAFYRWLKRDFETLFVQLPDRTRLQRALCVHRGCVRENEGVHVSDPNAWWPTKPIAPGSLRVSCVGVASNR